MIEPRVDDGCSVRPRPPVLAPNGMVSASHPAIAFAGARILADAGNAVDATLAMAAMRGWCYPVSAASAATRSR